MEQRKWCVYKHTNIINKKSYIGITSQLPQERWKNGVGYKHHKKFYNAIKKYGWNNFTHEVLFTNLNHQDAIEKEKQLIFQYDTVNNGYNATQGGEGTQGYHHTIEKKEQISNSLKIFLKNHPQHVEKRKQILLTPQNWQKRQQGVNKYFAAGSDNAKNRVSKNRKKVICLNTGQIFNSVKEASQWCHVDNSGISKCLKGVQHTSGLHPNTHQPLKWQYVDVDSNYIF